MKIVTLALPVHVQLSLLGLRGLQRKYHSRYSQIMASTVTDLLRECANIPKPSIEGNLYDDVVKKSHNFPILFPTQTIRCKNLTASHSQEEITNNIKSTYPLMHEDVLKLVCSFILHKRLCGTVKEKALYCNMDVATFVNRLLKKRSVSFYGAGDKYILHSKQHGWGGWEKIGTDYEVPPLVLEDCLSYDEMRLSALLYVSGPTIFINDGSRYNAGEVNENNIERNGIIIGLIGTRFEVDGKMEYQDMVVDRHQNMENNGYTSIEASEDNSSSDNLKCKKAGRRVWSDFYGLPRLTYYDVQKLCNEEKALADKKDYDRQFVSDNTTFFDNYAYAKHLSMPFDASLLEANARGKATNKSAYLHIIGIGLGVWKIFSHQNEVFVKTFLDRIKTLAPQLPGLSDVHFAYFRGIDADILAKSGTFIECPTHPLGGIQIHLSNREPSSKLKGPHEGKLIVETYAWDGNAQPGNEFWDGSLTGSGDPAAACSSQVAELHNSHINTTFVSGNNLHIAGPHGVHHVSDYVKILMNCL